MRALISSPEGPRFAEVPGPEPKPNQVLVEVRHASVNFGEATYMARSEQVTPLGYDASGVVLRAAADGSGPGVGERVSAFGPGAWAEQGVFDTDAVAVVPDGVDLAVAAALPLAGFTALRTLRAAGPLLGRRVLVTGASGGVGRIAVQLARLGGAYVIASASRGEGLRELGAHEVVPDLDAVAAPVDVVLENVGGPQLVAAWGLLAPGGNLQSIGWASGAPAVIPSNGLFSLGAAKTLQSFADPASPGPDLATLLGLISEGALRIDVGWRGSWSHIEAAIGALLGREVTGKAVIAID